MKKVIITFVLVVMTASQAIAGKPTEVNICHWQEYNGIWKLITISEKAVAKHLTIHDDARPSEATNFTGIELDDSCAEVAGLPSCGTCYTNNNPDAGCSNAACQAIVGAADGFCIGDSVGYWDDLCVSEAMTLCEGRVCTQGSGD